MANLSVLLYTKTAQDLVFPEGPVFQSPGHEMARQQLPY